MMYSSRSSTKKPVAKKEREPKKPESQKYSLKLKLKNKERVARAVRKQSRVRKMFKNLMIQRAQKYLKKYKKIEKSEIEKHRAANKAGSFYVPPEPKVAFVVRIRGINGIAPKPRKVLQLFRLRQINNGVFIKLNKATLNMLRLIDPYVMWGYPTVKTVRQMMYKRGFLRYDGRREPLNNQIIQKKLGKFNIICVEDLIHEIVTCGPHFKEATRCLWHFKLKNPKGGFNKKGRHFVEGGDFGNRENLINKIVKKMI